MRRGVREGVHSLSNGAPKRTSDSSVREALTAAVAAIQRTDSAFDSRSTSPQVDIAHSVPSCANNPGGAAMRPSGSLITNPRQAAEHGTLWCR